MSGILYVKASPRGPRSHSVAVADAFLEAYLERNPDLPVTTRNLFEAGLPAFDGPALQAKYNVIHRLTHDPAQRKAWETVARWAEELKRCTLLLMAVPMWNFGLPYPLKHYLDLVVQPGLTFEVDEAGVRGLVPDKPTFIAYASGGGYPAGTPAEGMDHQRPYLEMILNYMGITTIRSVRVEGTLGGEKSVVESRRKAIEQARAAALA